MLIRRIGSIVLALGIAGCVVNGKKVFDLGTTSPTATSAQGQSSAPEPSAGASPSLTTATKSAGTDATRPAWCAGADGVAPDIEAALGNDYPHSVPAIVGSLCNPRTAKDHEQRAAIEARRQKWMKQLAMTEGDWTDAVEYAQTSNTDRTDPRVKPAYGLAWSALSPVQQFALLDDRTPNADDRVVGQDGGVYYIADALAMTATGRVALVARCIDEIGRSKSIRPWIACAGDFGEIDATKVASELRADTHASAVDRMNIRGTLAFVLVVTPAVTEKLDGFRADHSVGKRIAAADAARAEWQRGAKDRADLLALVGTMDDARAIRSEDPLAGCTDKTWDALARAIRALGAERFAAVDSEHPDEAFDRVVDVLEHDADGYLAMNAFVVCNYTTEPIALHFSVALGDWPGFRGPRTAAMSAAKNDKLTYKVTLPIDPSKAAKPRKASGGAGTIDSVKKSDDGVVVSFPAKSHVEDVCDRWVETNRVERVRNDGTVDYAMRCAKRKRATLDDTQKPFIARKRFATGLAKGGVVSATADTVVAVWRKAGERPTAVFGTELR